MLKEVDNKKEGGFRCITSEIIAYLEQKIIDNEENELEKNLYEDIIWNGIDYIIKKQQYRKIIKDLKREMRWQYNGGYTYKN